MSGTFQRVSERTPAHLELFFQAPGNACDIQLIQPLNVESPLYKRLERHGEGVHHIAFTTSHLEATIDRLKENGVSVLSDELVSDIKNPGLRWSWVLPSYANGVLIEVMDSYKVEGGRLTPD